MHRRSFLQRSAAALAAASLATRLRNAEATRPPNFVVVLCDDLGFGDVGAFGAKRVRTPHLDRMVREGTVLTDFYAAANLCTPSRAGLLTGRYPIRTGLAYEVILANDQRGLPQSEVTLAEALKPEYATALIGKWHLGHVAPFWPPTQQGFDLFVGLPYSHDMQPLSLYESHAPGVELTQQDVDFPRLTQLWFDRGLRFVDEHRNSPFLLMLTTTAPHVPLNPHPDFQGRSQAADYGDVVEELDFQIGRLLDHLRELGLERDTLVIVTSDNGPWFEGSTAGLRDRKGGAGWDGGYRVPFIARQPGSIPGGQVSDALTMNIDLLPTLVAWSGLSPPRDVQLDGLDISSVLRSNARSPHDHLLLFNNDTLAGIRTDRWKYVVQSYYRTASIPLDAWNYPLLFDLRSDPGEQYNVAARHPEVMREMGERRQRARQEFGLAQPAAPVAPKEK